MLTVALGGDSGHPAVEGHVVRHAPAARRVRIAVERLVGDAALARRLEARFAALPGVVEVHADDASGRVLVRYAIGVDPEKTLPFGRLSPATAVAAAPREILRDAVGRARSAVDAAIGGLRRKVDAVRAAPVVRPAPRRDAGDALPWHAISVEDVLRKLGTGEGGLPGGEAAVRIVRYGTNAVELDQVRSKVEIAADQLANLPTVLLLGSAVVSVALGDFFDAGAILVVVGANAVIGYHIERKNEQLLASWRKLEAGEAQVLRDDAVRSIPATELVPGDVVLLRSGDRVPADARIVDAHRLACDEAPLTGESEAQAKSAAPVVAEASLAERRSMAFAGTSVVSGRGRAVVVAIGQLTEVAAVRRLVSEAADPEAPLQKRLGDLGRRATYLGVGAAGLALVGGLLRGRPLAAAMRGAVALGVAAIPEGMPVVATAALVTTMSRMRAKGMVVRRVVSAETLGGVTVVCMDKTGTLTENEMRLEILELDSRRLAAAELRAEPTRVLDDKVTLALAAGVLNSDIEYHENGARLELAGSSTERALVRAAQQAGLDPGTLRRQFPRVALQERHGDVHYVMSLHDVAVPDAPHRRVAFLKGAPEQVLALCDRDIDGPLQPERCATFLGRNEALAASGHRVLALAWAPLGEAAPGDASKLPRPLPPFELLGLVGLRDPLRPGAAAAVATAARAGIRTLILTGDQRATAEAIAREVGLGGAAVDGGDLARRLEAGDPTANAELARVAALSRVSPADKVAIVRALRRAGEIVAMAGDGINDAPALKVADVGIAVGAHASDIARQTADVVLENADLQSILAAVGEGRIVQDNLRRSIRFLFASNLSEIVVSLVGVALGREPLTSLQLLWLNLLTDTLPALALALEPGDPEVLARRPAPPNAPILNREDWKRVVRDGAALAALGGAGYTVGASMGTFSTLTAGQLGYAVTCRARETRMEPQFIRLLGTAVALQGAALLLPPLQSVLRLPAAEPVPLAGFLLGLVLPTAVSAAARVLEGSPHPSHLLLRKDYR